MSRLSDHNCAPSVRSTDNQASCARIVPNPPGEAPMTATGLAAKTRGMSAGGREAQSIAFLNTPGILLLYSGVASSSPSALAIASFRSATDRSEEHTSELQSLMRISYAVFCLKKKKNEKQ